MPPTVTGEGSVSQWLSGFWEYYRRYTHTAAHAASAAALTAFGLLVFVDRLFVLLAIAAYVCPPLLLYSIGADAGVDSEPATRTGERVEHRGLTTGGSGPRTGAETTGVAGATGDDATGGGDGDADGSDGDSDADGDDSDSDTDGSDSDTDGSDGDSDSDD